MSYPPTPQRKSCDCSDPCISTDDVYYAGPNLPNSGVNTSDLLTEVIEKLDAIYAVPTLQRVTEMGNYTTLPIIADSFVKIGGDGTNLLLDNGTVLPIADLPSPTAPGLQEVLDVGGVANNKTIKLIETISNNNILISTNGITLADNINNEICFFDITGLSLVTSSNVKGNKLDFTKLGYTNTTFKFPEKPNNTYTLATLDDIPSVTGFVPYTGATDRVDLGINNLYLGSGNDGAKIIMNGNKGTNYIDIENAGARMVYQMDSIVYISKQFGGTKTISLFTDATTGNDYGINFPNASGTVALTSDIPTAPYKVYTALLTQTGTDAPTAVVLENTLEFTPTFGYSAVGSYIITGDFVLDKTYAIGLPYGGSGGNYILSIDLDTGGGSIQIYTTYDNTYFNDLLQRSPFEIRVYN